MASHELRMEIAMKAALAHPEWKQEFLFRVDLAKGTALSTVAKKTTILSEKAIRPILDKDRNLRERLLIAVLCTIHSCYY